ncbi:AAA family ATPase, partial [Candidatus Bipolaricaulota bacterium]|nr:AAA family ATPase [Candidatus Bipolaricaulota bacterium]
MFRTSMYNLVKWKNDENRKPLLIRGARQVGKTWLMKEFGKIHYEKCAYINFENNERMEGLFSSDFDLERIITALQIETGVTIDAGNTLIIFDEVQEVPQALTSLKYFCENAPEYHIVAAGSLLGVALHPGTSFPVGKVEFMNLYPLDFLEFLSARGRDDLVKLLKSKDFDLITGFKGKYIDLLKQYYYIGGMPEVVASFIEEN